MGTDADALWNEIKTMDGKIVNGNPDGENALRFSEQ